MSGIVPGIHISVTDSGENGNLNLETLRMVEKMYLKDKISFHIIDVRTVFHKNKKSNQLQLNVVLDISSSKICEIRSDLNLPNSRSSMKIRHMTVAVK